jgi:hypothetical protein
MKPLKLMLVGCLVLTAFAFLPSLVTPVHAAESVTCPTEVNLNPGQTMTITCTANWSAGNGSAQTSAVNCTTGFVCTGWSWTAVSPASWGATPSGTQTLTFMLTAPTAAVCTTNNDCVTQIELDTSGGGFGVVAARATITITVPEFGIGVASAVAAGFVVLAFLRRGKVQGGATASLA